MAKQTVYLFVRAFIIGLLLNLGIQYVSDSTLSQQETSAPEPEQRILTHASVTSDLLFLKK